jgi:membrane-associated phospholipid phosphatase
MCIAWYRRRSQALSASILPAVVLFSFSGLQLTSFFDRVTPRVSNTFDLYLYFVDGSFGVEPSIWLHQKIGSEGFGRCLELVYEASPLAIGLTCAALMWRGRQLGKVVALFILSSFAGVLCYYLLPACGPGYLLGPSFLTRNPFSPETASLIPQPIAIDLQFRRNCMPSLHMTWALMVAWLCCREFRLGRWAAIAFAMLTSIATIWNGEHYLVDIVGAFPFSFAIYLACMGQLPFSNPKRLIPFASSICGFLLWVVVIRQDPNLLWVSPILPWSMAALIVAGTLRAVRQEHKLQLIYPAVNEAEPIDKQLSAHA